MSDIFDHALDAFECASRDCIDTNKEYHFGPLPKIYTKVHKEFEQVYATDKAILLECAYFQIWVPKSLTREVNGKLEVETWFYAKELKKNAEHLRQSFAS